MIESNNTVVMKGVTTVPGVLISRVLKSCKYGGHRWQVPDAKHDAKQTLMLMLMLLNDGHYLTSYGYL